MFKMLKKKLRHIVGYDAGGNGGEGAVAGAVAGGEEAPAPASGDAEAAAISAPSKDDAASVAGDVSPEVTGVGVSGLVIRDGVVERNRKSGYDATAAAAATATAAGAAAAAAPAGPTVKTESRLRPLTEENNNDIDKPASESCASIGGLGASTLSHNLSSSASSSSTSTSTFSASASSGHVPSASSSSSCRPRLSATPAPPSFDSSQYASPSPSPSLSSSSSSAFATAPSYPSSSSSLQNCPAPPPRSNRQNEEKCEPNFASYSSSPTAASAATDGAIAAAYAKRMVEEKLDSFSSRRISTETAAAAAAAAAAANVSKPTTATPTVTSTSAAVSYSAASATYATTTTSAAANSFAISTATSAAITTASSSTLASLQTHDPSSHVFASASAAATFHQLRAALGYSAATSSSSSVSNASTSHIASSSSFGAPSATLPSLSTFSPGAPSSSHPAPTASTAASNTSSAISAAAPETGAVAKKGSRRRLSRTERRLRKWRRQQQEIDAANEKAGSSSVSYDFLPEYVLEKILAYTPMADSSRLSLVCRAWDDKMTSCPRAWPTLRLTPSTFTRSRYNLYRKSGRGPATDRLYLCLQQKGQFFRHVIVEPNGEMHVLFEHLRVLKEYVASHVWELDHSTAFPRLLTFEYTHTPVKVKADALTSRSRRRQAYGNLVGLEDETFETLHTIVHGLRGLKRLVLKNCFLGDLEPLRQFMDAVVMGKSDSIEYLDVTNLTKTPIESLWFPVFVNLKTLVITTNILGETLLAEIGNSGVRDLVLDHDSHTSPFQNSLVEESWISLKQNNPHIRVTLLSTSGDQDVIHQDLAPVKCIIYKSERVGLDSMGLMSHSHDYCDSLEMLAQEGLVKYRVAKSFHDRVDMNLVMLVRSSSRLHTLALRERVSTATLLVLASSAKSLKSLYVRRNAVIKRSDWASRRNVQSVALSYEQTESEIGRCLGDANWKMLSDKEYKKLRFHWTDSANTKRDF